MNKIYSFVLMIVLAHLIALTMSIGESHAEIITVEPASPEVKYCYPFGMGITEWNPSYSTHEWTPYCGFIYKNVPPFDIEVGDMIAFDLGAPNDFDIELDIAMAPTNENGGTREAEPFIKLVSNTQKPATPRGDAVAGNYELQFSAEADFAFPGGGLIMLFSNPSTEYQNDYICDQVTVCGNPSDTSGYFVKRFFRDTDGLSPWDNESDNGIGAFRIITGDNTTISSSSSSSTTTSPSATTSIPYPCWGEDLAEYQESCCEWGYWDMGDYCCKTWEDCFHSREDEEYCLKDPYRTDNPCGLELCWIAEGLRNDEIKIDIVRRFRDEVLSKTAMGREYIRLYYQWSPFIVQAMEADEEFKKKAQDFLEQLLPTIEAMVQ